MMPSIAPQRAFVLLRHTVGERAHYDLMFDLGEDRRLATWRLPTLPTAGGEAISATRLPDHRRAYLTYQGPVRGDRGEVRIAAEGTYLAELQTASRWIVRLTGEGLHGRFELRRAGGPGADAWRLAPLDR